MNKFWLAKLASCLPSLFFATLIFASTSSRAQNNSSTALPPINISDNNITVSGLSSGAFFAVQMAVAHSEKITGVASFAGGIYGCAKGDPQRAQGPCMKTLEQVDVADSIEMTDSSAHDGSIDDPTNLARTKVLLFHGTKDGVVNPLSSAKLEEYFSHYGATVKDVFDVASGHGFPSLTATVPCGEARIPYVNDCGVDGPELVFKALYETVKDRGVAKANRLFEFNQQPYTRSGDQMGSAGHVYIPEPCETKSCRLHIAFHGCLQTPMFVQKAFVAGAGFNEWAESNEVVILYPSIQGGAGNPYSCWDWFGYTNQKYLTTEGVQLQAVMKMVEQLAE